VSLAARALALTTSALIEDAIILISLYFAQVGFNAEVKSEVSNLRYKLDRPVACCLAPCKALKL
jgi:hypothetical protein